MILLTARRLLLVLSSRKSGSGVRRLLPVFIFLAVALTGAVVTFTVWHNENQRLKTQFEVIADGTADRLLARVGEHLALLTATVAYYAAAEGDFDRLAFRRFVDHLDVEGRYKGILGIGFAQIFPPDQEGRIRDAIRVAYGINRGVWPESDAELRTAIVMLEPLNDINKVAIGYDMFSEQRRRDAMIRAIATSSATATAPVHLVQETDDQRQAGFLVFTPLRSGDDVVVRGFAYAAFRAGDLHRAAFNGMPRAEMETRDAGDPDAPALFTTAGYEPDGDHRFTAERSISIGGRTWQIRLHETSDFHLPFNMPYTWITGVITLLAAVAVAMASRWQLKAIDNAHALVALTETSLVEKDLMLQEMKHRIKNSIARINAIARQTAASSDTMDEFSQSFTARLQSMAKAQDMLTRSRLEGADLRELLMSELEQVQGSHFDEISIEGEPVTLDGSQTQALGLTFHELATNALKYGVGGEGTRLEIRWERVRGRPPELRLHWRESGTVRPGKEPPAEGAPGFGTRLIDASIRAELRGRIEREFLPDGLRIEIVIPLESAMPCRKA